MFAYLVTLAAISPKLSQFFHQYGVLALFILVFLQDVGVPTGLPGTVLVLLGGYLVFSHVVGLHEAAIAIALGAFLGASGMFFLARYGGRPLVLRLGRFVGLTDKRLDAAALALDRVGPPMLLLTRVAPGTRVYMTIFAGISGWTYRRFALWTGLFVVLWAYGFVLLGNALGNRWEDVARFIGRSSFLILFVALAMVVLYYGLRFLLTYEHTKDTGFAQVVNQGLQMARIQRFIVPAMQPVLMTEIVSNDISPVAAEEALSTAENLASPSGADAPATEHL